MTTHILQEGQAPSLTHSGHTDAPCPADAPLEGDRFSFVIGQESAGERIDKVLADYKPGQSRSYLKKLIKDGYVRILNDPSGSPRQGRDLKPSTPVGGGETVDVILPVSMLPEILPENIPLDILYEDRDVLVVNKPKGMVVHPAAGHYTGTLVNALLYHCQDLSGINGEIRPGIVHRIDKDTTGCLVACKNDMAHEAIARQLETKTCSRKYKAIVTGNITHNDLYINA
ncbi:MAG: hypothetical protein IJG15_06745, partial [Lachnospiraceae bacterium]|nr:hypothetical protein [Lachnospiraceae bacterium]